MKADTIKAALSTTAMKTPRNDMALSSSIIQNQGRFPLNRPRTRGNPGRDGSLISGQTRGVASSGAETLRRLAGGSARFIRNLTTLETQSLEKLNVTHQQGRAKSAVQVHQRRFLFGAGLAASCRTFRGVKMAALAGAKKRVALSGRPFGCPRFESSTWIYRHGQRVSTWCRRTPPTPPVLAFVQIPSLRRLGRSRGI